MITRSHWKAGTYPAQMLEAAWKWLTNDSENLAGERKCRLYFAALCRQFWPHLPWLARQLVELCERQVDGEFDESVLQRPLEYLAEGIMYRAWYGSPSEQYLKGSPDYERYLIPVNILRPLDADLDLQPSDTTLQDQLGRAVFKMFAPMPQFDFVSLHDVNLIREIIGNPFHPCRFNAAWKTETAVGLAAQMYDARAFSAMPILADALQDAGCENHAILIHCREPGQHVRGCWVVDLLLGKQ